MSTPRAFTRIAAALVLLAGCGDSQEQECDADIRTIAVPLTVVDASTNAPICTATVTENGSLATDVDGCTTRLHAGQGGTYTVVVSVDGYASQTLTFTVGSDACDQPTYAAGPLVAKLTKN